MTNRQQQDPLGITGTILAEKYRIDGVIGEGGFSIVYKAEHLIWQQPVAIKCFRILAQAPEAKRDELLDSFIQEGRLLANLSSRSAAIVQARDIGKFTTSDGMWIPYMVLEWLEGKPLDHVLFEEKIAGKPPREVHETLALLEPVAVALEIAHAKNIAHRDIKPANVFVIGDPRAPSPFTKVLDFGIAKVMADHAASAAAMAQTGKEITAFTPNYGAPEQFSRQYGATGPWTDVFAMALIFIEVLRSGDPALEGEDYVQFAIASRDPTRRPTPRNFGLQVSQEVEEVFLKALAVSPADRYPTMGQFWAALHDAVFPGDVWNPGTTSGISSMTASSSRLSRVSTRQPTSPNLRGKCTEIMGEPTAPSAMPTGQLSQNPPTNQNLPTNQNPPTNEQAQSAAMMQSAPSFHTPMSSLKPASETPKKSMMTLALVAGVALLGGSFAAYKMFTKGQSGATNPTPIASSSSAPDASSSAAPSVPASVSAARPTECPAGMVLVPGGKFFMGSDDPGFKLWQPSHKVFIDTFCVGVHEVTAGEYKECSDLGECKRPEAAPNWPKTGNTTDEEHEQKRKAYAELCTFGKPGFENHPVNCVSWNQADAYCKWKKWRLPTEAEWEYAARGSDGRKYPWGDEPGAEHMNAGGKEFAAWEKAAKLKSSGTLYDIDDGYPGTAPVGSFPKGKTKFGADDFVGNVWEWTSDWFELYKPDELINPKGAPAGDKKAIRGGGFNGGVQLWLDPAFRFHQVPDATTPVIGFRCVTTL